MMKSFKEYLVENKKVYSFKVKVAGDLPEKFQESLKSRLDRCKVATLEKISTTPIQKVPLDFPGHENMEVSIFEVVCEYPITAPEIAEDLKQIGIDEDCFRVRGSSEPSEIDQLGLGEKQKIDLALLFTWREVARMKNSVSTNLLILDEVFDSSLDASATGELLSILRGLGKETNLFVISHKGDILVDKFLRILRFEKVNDFSKMCDES